MCIIIWMSKEFKANQNQKLDNQELNDWLDSLDAVVENHGREGAKLILEKLEKRAKDLRVLYHPFHIHHTEILYLNMIKEFIPEI